jgi:hypothetical protein
MSYMYAFGGKLNDTTVSGVQKSKGNEIRFHDDSKDRWTGR